MLADFNTVYSHFLQNREITTDSRRITPGSVFFALKGDQYNGNDYAISAIENGASVAVVDDPRFLDSEKYLVVDNVLETLQKMANLHRENYQIPVIAITGTNGKTTTKELISAVLASKYRVISTTGNLNNHIGVPLTLLGIRDDTQIAVIEMGANHPGEIGALCRIANPDFGLITNIGKAHLEGFGSLEGVREAKTELYRYLKSKNGRIFLHNNDPVLVESALEMETINYGIPPAGICLISTEANPFLSLNAQFSKGERVSISSRLYGRYNTPNILAAMCVGNYFGVPLPDIITAIESYEPKNNRSQILKSEKNLIVMDAYNANPGSMGAAITSFVQSDLPQKMVILGDMLELGETTDSEHQRILEIVYQSEFEQVYLVGPVFSRINTFRNFTCFHDSELARLWFQHHEPVGHSILIKGSRGIKLEKVAEVL